jgi:hypothetical protein
MDYSLLGRGLCLYTAGLGLVPYEGSTAIRWIGLA